MSGDDQDLLQEFKTEGLECLEECEAVLLKTERPETFEQGYREAYRVFHSLKGLSGMFGLKQIESTFHFLESLLSKYENQDYFPPELVDYLFTGVDATSKLIEGQEVHFELYDPVERKLGLSVQPSLPNEDHAFDVIALSDQQLPAASASKSLEGPDRALSGEKNKSSHYLYLVDDEADLLAVMKEIVESYDVGLKVQTFTSAEAALEKFDKTPLHEQPMMVISDMKMPGGMSGVEFMHQLGLRNNNIPFALLSGHLDAEVYEEALAQGAYAVMSKPMQPSQLKFQIYSGLKYKQSLDLVRKSLKFMFYVFGSTDGLAKEDQKLLENEIQWIMQRVESLKAFGKEAS
jgi:FixJ family two-component response regulator/HPt (histidine-containing phosphotransfer) domain-containing protein